MRVRFSFMLGMIVCFLSSTIAQDKVSSVVPFYNNGYSNPRALNEEDEFITKSGLTSWTDANRVNTIYFYVKVPTKVYLALQLRAVSTKCTLSIQLDNKPSNNKMVPIDPNQQYTELALGDYTLLDTGYHFLKIKGVASIKSIFPAIESLIIKNHTPGSILFNLSNYRGAASTHLRYIVPEDSAIQWFYTEVKVPDEVSNSIHAYYETNGFHSGYGGIQINAPNERRFIFSIWSLYKTDDPSLIPSEYEVRLNKKGNAVFTGEFGNEGSGGHSHLVFPWKTNTTYRFLTGITSLKGDSATYVGYYAEPTDNYQWHLLSKWTQHKTDTKTGFKKLYAFVENFGDNGDDYFKANYGNQWAITFNGTWMELTEAKFTTTAHPNRHQRFDYGAGVENGMFYMYSGGFKHVQNINAGDIIKRPSTKKHIHIDFEKLEVIKQ